LKLPAELHALFVQAGAEHDRGKQWLQWQRAIGNTDTGRPLGKSARSWFDHRINDGYRHELGSLVDLGGDQHWVQSHLIATHHGWGRPTYRSAALNKPGCAAVADAVAHGFSALQRSIGPWASCYLEALLKAADVLAETKADTLLARGPVLPQALAPTLWSPSLTQPAQEHITLALDTSNFGEYLAALGLVALLDRQGYALTCCWHAAGFFMLGASAQDACNALQSLSTAQAKPDATATVPDQQDAPYPPLLLHMPDGTHWALNHWLDQRLRASSGWKLGAGQTTALGTLNSLLAACQRTWAHPDLAAADLSAQTVLQALWTFGGRKVQADASKFRFDAATNWAAQDAGFSLNEAEHFKSTRPWVELLSALVLQYFFLPPADATRRYYTWDVPLSPTLALAAAKGLLPQCSQGYEPVIVPSGKMKDVFTSKLIYTKGTQTWQSFIRLV
jgi:CRISPR-associated endonuclease/helicase Cas3